MAISITKVQSNGQDAVLGKNGGATPVTAWRCQVEHEASKATWRCQVPKNRALPTKSHGVPLGCHPPRHS